MYNICFICIIYQKRKRMANENFAPFFQAFITDYYLVSCKCVSVSTNTTLKVNPLNFKGKQKFEANLSKIKFFFEKLYVCCFL